MSKEIINNALFCALVGAMDDYMEATGKEIDELAGMASVRGWASSRYEEGKQHRAAIRKIRKEIGLPKLKCEIEGEE